MSRAVEKWALVVMFLAACVLLVGELIDRDWVWAGLWALALVLVAKDLVRRRRQPAG